MGISRIDGNTRTQQTWNVEQVDIPPLGTLPEGKVEKVTPDTTLYFTDTISSHQDQVELGDARKATPYNIDVSSLPSRPADLPQTGWSSRESISSAKEEAATSSASRPTSWVSWLGSAASSTVDSAKEMFSTTASKTTDLMSDAANYVKGFWSTQQLAERAFSNPKVETVEIPTVNLDGSRNPLGGRRINREDYRELQRFQEDMNALLNYLVSQPEGANLELLVMTLTKALSKDKEEVFEHLRNKIQHAHKERAIDAQLSKAESLIYIERIKANRWYEWYSEVSTHTTMAVGAIALGTLTGQWPWAIDLLASSGIGLVNLYFDHWIERRLASATAWASTELLGGDYATTHKSHADAYKAITKFFTWLTPITTGLKHDSAMGGVGSKVIQGLNGIATMLGQGRQVYLQHKADSSEAQINFLADRQREREKAITSAIKDLGTAYSFYGDGWKNGGQMARSASETARQMMRNN